MPLESLAASLIPSAFKAIQGIGQRKRANAINPINPKYQMNSGVIDNARILGERAGNYQIPGYSQARTNIQANYGQAFNQGVQGASSGGDVLDLATKLAYGQGNQLNQLAAQNAAGAENAQMQSLQANAAAGEEYQAKNAYERDEYNKKLAEKAALMEGGTQNIYGALTEGSTAVTDFLNPKKGSNGLDPAMLMKLLSGGI
jgi:hypothetical protein